MFQKQDELIFIVNLYRNFFSFWLVGCVLVTSDVFVEVDRLSDSSRTRRVGTIVVCFVFLVSNSIFLW